VGDILSPNARIYKSMGTYLLGEERKGNRGAGRGDREHPERLIGKDRAGGGEKGSGEEDLGVVGP